MRLNTSILSSLLSLGAVVSADPTWPAATDELEELMFQISGFRGRLFGSTVMPCTSEASGPGRINAAEWLRTAFHDMSTANTFFGSGGLDGSLQYELSNGENTGPGFETTLKFFNNYYTTRSTVSDLIALGVYFSVRSCGGLPVPIRGGRLDATTKGNTGVPQPANSLLSFQQQFERMGFSNKEMIEVTACGHSLGGVHSTEFPDLVPAGTFPNDMAPLDNTPAVFDNAIITEFLANTTKDVLTTTKTNKNSDFRVFQSDGNATMREMSDNNVFQSTCQRVFQKMIEVVPPGVTLSDTITPYFIKPINLQLTLNTAATTMQLTGYIRVRTTTLTLGQIGSMTLNYKDRTGGNNCGNGNCVIPLSLQGTGKGFDDTFAFFPINAAIPTASGISSFTVTLNLNDGTKQTYDNNGKSYPVQDAVMIMGLQSCLRQSTGVLNVTAAVRNDRLNQPISMALSIKQAQTGSPVANISQVSVSMDKGACAGPYTLFTASYQVPGTLTYATKIDIVSGEGSSAIRDDFNDAALLGGSCQPYEPPSASQCSGGSTSSTVSSSSSTRTTSSSVISSTTTSSVISSTTTSTAASTTTLAHTQSIGAYKFVSCWIDSSVRALNGPVFAYDGMTLESCMKNCTGYAYWGTEYGRECYCGNSLDSTSASAPLADCSMTCSGNSLQYCGGSWRLELYSNAQSSTVTSATTSTSPTSTLVTSTSKASTSTTSVALTTSLVTPTASSTISSSATASATLGVKPTVAGYSRVGCWTDVTNRRTLTAAYHVDDAMTLELCASKCAGYTYFGAEYSKECFCGNTLDTSSQSAPDSDCNMVCGGNKNQYCGAGDRLELYKLGIASSSSSVVAATSPSSSPVQSSTSRSSSIQNSSSAATIPVSSTATTISQPSSSTSSSSVASIATSSVPFTTLAPATTSSPASTTSRLSTSTATGLRQRPTIGSYSFVSCYTEATNGNRALGKKQTSDGSGMTLEACAAFCSDYHYFGTEWSQECYCGNVIDSTAAPAQLSECDMTCSGDKTQYCGAGNRLQLYYSNSTTGPSQPPTISAPVSSGSNAQQSWSWYGCQTEAANGARALNANNYSSADKMTLETCATFCSGYKYFGTEYGGECYCGNDFQTGSVKADSTDDCSMACTGNSKELCGAGNRLSVYTKKTT